MPCPPPYDIPLTMSKKDTESGRYIVRGVLALVGGAVLLLMPRLFGLPDFWNTPSVFAGAFSLLYGNGCIFYGLLIHAGPVEPR